MIELKHILKLLMFDVFLRRYIRNNPVKCGIITFLIHDGLRVKAVGMRLKVGAFLLVLMGAFILLFLILTHLSSSEMYRYVQCHIL